MRKQLSVQEKIAKMLREEGEEVPEYYQSRDDVRREADATILYIENPNKFLEKACLQCLRLFATNYAAVAMCSDNCRREWLHSRGIEWNPMKTQNERWGGRIPLVVPPHSIGVAKEVLAQQSSLFVS